MTGAMKKRKKIQAEKTLVNMAATALDMPLAEVEEVLLDISNEFDSFNEFVKSGEMARRLAAAKAKKNNLDEKGRSDE